MDGHGALFATLSGTRTTILGSFGVDLPPKVRPLLRVWCHLPVFLLIVCLSYAMYARSECVCFSMRSD